MRPSPSPHALPHPYKGLVPYTEEDAALFFGRDRERELIEANLMASRLTVLYGPSGVGKTSVLHAAVIHALRRQALDNFHTFGAPEFAVVAVSQWAGDPIASIETATHEGALAALGAAADVATAPAGDLVQTLRTWGERLNGELLIVLDQFEEYFLYHSGTTAEGVFIDQLSRAISDPTVPARFLISLREDALAQLDRFKGRIEGLFDNTLRIDRLDRAAARRAVEGPIEQVNSSAGAADPPWTLEAGLVNQVLDQVQTGRVVFGRDGAGGRSSTPTVAASQARVDAPYLQLVMQRLWQEEAVAGSHALRRVTLARLGGADRIVRTHLDGVMARLPAAARETAHAVFHHLVTPSGMKIAHSAADLAQYTQQPEAEVQRLLDALSSGQARVLRPVASSDDTEPRRYEIHHDVLAAAIIDWRQRYLQRDAESAANAAQLGHRRALKLLACVSTLPVLVLLQIILSIQLSSKAEPVFAALTSVRAKPVERQATPAAESLVPSLLAGLLRPELAAGLVSITVSQSRTEIRIASDGLFERGDASLNASRRPLLDRLSEALNRTNGPILIVGHTDSVPIRSFRYPSNFHLSLARANAVKAALANLVLADRMRAEGRADTEPLTDNATAEGRASNRRVEIAVFEGERP